MEVFAIIACFTFANAAENYCDRADPKQLFGSAEACKTALRQNKKEAAKNVEIRCMKKRVPSWEWEPIE